MHLGHVALARAAQAAYGLDQVWFMVNPAPGHKVGVTAYADRLAMVKLAVADVPGLLVYLGEFVHKPHNIGVFLTMINQYSRDDFVFIVGADVLLGMQAWEGYEQVVREAQFVVAQRAGALVPTVEKKLQARWFAFDEHIGASSRDIRTALRVGGGCPAELDARVYEYILGHRLYRVAS